MSRRAWLLNIGTGLCASLLPACSTFSGAMDLSRPTQAGAWWISPEERTSPATVTTAPERPAANAFAKQPAMPTGRPIEPVAYSQQTSGRDLLVDPPTREQAEKNARLPRQSDAMMPGVSAEETRAKPAPEPAVVAALRCFMEKRPVEAMEWLRQYDKLSQDLLLPMLPLAIRFTEGGLQKIDSQEATALVTQLRRLQATLEPRSELVIDKMCFCRHVDKFGVFERWEEERPFRPPVLIQAYVELQNFTTERIRDAYEVRLSSRVEIRDYRGNIVWFNNFGAKSDLSKSPRHDFFNRYEIPLASTFPPGRYTLWLRVNDVPTGRTASRSLDFEVAPARGRGDI